jgi:hypothetical protein
MLSLSRETNSHSINIDGDFYSASFEKKREEFDYSMEIK